MIKDKIIENLKQVYDPEISINVYDLGLIYDIDIDSLPKVTITHTLTSAFCPEADTIVQSINAAVMRVNGVVFCDIETTFDPPFTMDMVSEEGKLMMGWWKNENTLYKRWSAFCPEADLIVSDIRVATSQIEGVTDVNVITTFEPPFGPEMMSEKAKLELGI